MDNELKAKATLVGLVRLNALCTISPTILDSIEKVKEIKDYRDELPSMFLDFIIIGYIRTDSLWSKGPEKELVKLANLIAESQMKWKSY